MPTGPPQCAITRYAQRQWFLEPQLKHPPRVPERSWRDLNLDRKKVCMEPCANRGLRNSLVIPGCAYSRIPHVTLVRPNRHNRAEAEANYGLKVGKSIPLSPIASTFASDPTHQSRRPIRQRRFDRVPLNRVAASSVTRCRVVVVHLFQGLRRCLRWQRPRSNGCPMDAGITTSPAAHWQWNSSLCIYVFL